MALAITYLFVPGNRPDRFDKALASGADAVILDLEDAVAAGAKDAARAAVGAWLAGNRPGDGRLLVRINDETTAWFEDDLELLRGAGSIGVMLPKAESAGQIARVLAALDPDVIVVPLIETARGLREVAAIAAADGVQRLAFGTLDFAVDLDLSGDERGLIAPAMAIALASRCAGKAAPIAGVTPTVNDDEALSRDLAFARAVGFNAKLCIHPAQVAAVRRALAPTARELDWAARVIAAAEASAGAVQVDGRMVDRPVLLKAQSILDRAPSSTSN
jgi:citrate lyase subunit beta / citryl-CoA lyase